ncbi:MAG TPA: hypothetical protein VFO19_08530 [Vicinamibacterales bacterium]|nr:hypothetical protein [Vicinamibacterales bacterium]
MYLLLGHSQDPCCAGVAARLEARGLDARIAADPLAPPAKLTWRLDARGLTSRLAAGAADDALEGVLVRDASWIDPAGWEPDDHAYMLAELRAVMLAWLAALSCPVVNRPDAANWYRAGVSMLTWRSSLRDSGLRMPEVVITSDIVEADAFRRRLGDAGVDGAVYSPLSHGAAYLLDDEDAWKRIAAMQARTTICLTEPHGPVTLACVVGGEVIWNGGASSDAIALEAALRRFASAARLSFVEIALARVRAGLAVVHVDPRPRVERFDAPAAARILDAVVDQLTAARTAATGALVLS